MSASAKAFRTINVSSTIGTKPESAIESSFGYYFTPDLNGTIGGRVENMRIYNPTNPTPPDLQAVLATTSSRALAKACRTTREIARSSPRRDITSRSRWSKTSASTLPGRNVRLPAVLDDSPNGPTARARTSWVSGPRSASAAQIRRFTTVSLQAVIRHCAASTSKAHRRSRRRRAGRWRLRVLEHGRISVPDHGRRHNAGRVLHRLRHGRERM